MNSHFTLAVYGINEKLEYEDFVGLKECEKG